MLTRTKEFQKLCQNASVGTTNRNYLQEKLFLNFEIPLPSIKEQGVLVNTFYEKINEAVSLAKQADSLERGIEKYIVKELGLSKKVEIEKNKGLHFVNFVDLNRWDTSFLFQKENENISKYPLVTYNNLFISLNNGMPARNYTENGTRFLKVADIKNNKIDNTNIKFIETCRATDFIEKDTLLITRKGTVGNSFYVTEHNKYTASSEIFIIKLNNNVEGNYLAEINLIEFVKKQYKEKNTGTIMPSLSQEKLKEILIPLPSIEKQREIALTIKKMKAKLNSCIEQSEKVKFSAQQEFEKAIFS